MVRPRRRLGAFALALTVFCCVSGGPYGLEETIRTAGPGLGVLLILLVPLVWALPDALTTAELAPAIPEEGGYVVWVRRAMGPFWGFVNAWWTWMYALIDATIYPVLFAGYLSRLLATTLGVPAFSPLSQWAVAAGVIAAFTALNVRGARSVGSASVVFTAIIVLPFLALGGIGLWRWAHEGGAMFSSFVPPGTSVRSALADGLGLVMWNYLGWDALSTVAGEVERPERAYPLALALSLPLVVGVYLLPVLGTLPFVPDPARWAEGSWPDLGRAVAGPWMGLAINAVGLVSASALFSASLLGSSRIPFVLSEGGFLPRGLTDLHPRFGTPWKALLVCGAIYVLLAPLAFRKLVELNVILYGAALLLEIGALLLLRRKEPDLPRPFRVPGGWPVLWLVLLSPAAVIATMAWTGVAEDGWAGQWLDLGLLASGPAVYAVVLGWRRRA